MPGTRLGMTADRAALPPALNYISQPAVAEHIDHALLDRQVGGAVGVSKPSATISARTVPPWATATVSACS